MTVIAVPPAFDCASGEHRAGMICSGRNRSGSRIIIPYNERELLEIEKLKLQTYKLRKQIDELEGNLVPISKLEELKTTMRLDVFEIFREYMIEQLYLDLAEETNDKIIYSILIKACQSAAKELF